MPVARLIDPEVVVQFLADRGFQVVRQNARLVVLRSESVACDVIVQLFQRLTPTVVGDILTNAEVPEAEWETVL